MERGSRRRGRLNEKQEEAAERLKRIREGGGLRIDEHESDDEADVYDEVDEREYESRKAGERQDAKDFIEDDEGIGYLDEEDEPEDDDELRSKKGGKRQKTEGTAGGLSQSKKLSTFFKKGAVKSSAKAAAAAAAASNMKVDEDELLDSLLGAAPAAKPLPTASLAAHPKGKSRGGGIQQSAGDIFQRQRARAALSATVALAAKQQGGAAIEEADDVSYGFDDAMEPAANAPPASGGASGLVSPGGGGGGGDATAAASSADAMRSPSGAAASDQGVAAAAAISSPPCDAVHSPPQQPARKNGRAAMQTYDQASAANQWMQAPNAPMDSAAGAGFAAGAGSSLLQEDGSLLMYWFDAHEEKFAQPGTIYLFGKVWANARTAKSPAEQQWLSCCVKVSDVDRNMYVVPRKFMIDSRGNDTEEEVALLDFENPNCVFFEFSERMKQAGINIAGCVKAAPAPRYCTFDEEKVSRGLHQCLKFKAPSSVREIPQEARQGNAYSAIAGCDSSCIEQLLLRRKVMGPCWLRIEGASPNTQSFSWCKAEFNASGIKGITVSDEHRNTAPPPLRVMSISLKTVFNENKRQNEVVMAGTTVIDKVNIDSPTVDWEQQSATHVVLRAPEHCALPLELRETVRTNKIPIAVQPSERALLNCFFARIHRFDPDVLVGHNAVAFDLEVLLARAGSKDNKCSNWDRLGRLKRSQAPNIRGGGNGGEGSAYAKYVAGRLLCDTYISARELVRQTTYTLKELCQIQLGVRRANVENEDIPRHYSQTDHVIGLATHTATDTKLVLRLMFHLQVLPLTKQLTNLAGNLWARTMRGGKAERNEHLLLHEFFRARHETTKAKFLLPEKKSFAKGKAGEPKGRRVRKKAAYAGGLVLEPKKGFYDKMILALDFNSLYPSIIQEYNICFTTVDPKPKRRLAEDEEGHEQDGEDALPPIPSAAPKGILPRVIKTLVERRSAVKKELKSAQPGTTSYQQLDIRQMALKLTANSMYGCLGFTYSRFYAKPLAQLITSQGRQMLARTKEITETQCGLEVVYGDTDSIMVNTRMDDYDAAISKGKEVMKKINEPYKCVEIDIDYVFKNMLLLKKKKYAAIMMGKGKDGTMQYTRKTSGLDMVRRDWCPISKEVSGYVLDRLLSGMNREDVVEQVHTYLREKSEKVTTEPWEGFVITKQLTKLPREYADAKNQPHVQVAIKMMEQDHIQVQAGMSIQYIVVEGNTSSVAERSMSPKQFLDAQDRCKIDYEWYLSSQLHPPVARLCEVIEGTDSSRIADCLGLDSSKFQVSASYTANNDDESSAISMDDNERYKTCERLAVNCPKCHADQLYEGLVCSSDGLSLSAGFACRVPECSGRLAGTEGAGENRYLCNRLTAAVRHYVSRYYSAPYVCEEQSCRFETQDVAASEAGHAPESQPCPLCSATMHKALSAQDLYNQLSYLRYLFDHDRQRANLLQKHETLPMLSHMEIDAMEMMKQEVTKFLDQSRYRFVDLEVLSSILNGTAGKRAASGGASVAQPMQTSA